MRGRTYKITNRSYLQIAYLYFAFLFLFILYFLINYKTLCLSYNTSDWLINYEDGGFKRRGLGGTIVFFLSDILNIKISNIVFGLELVCYGIFFFYLTKLLPKKLNIGLFIILICPLSLGFNILEPNIVGKKEILLFALFSYFNYLILYRKLNRFKEIVILLILFFITLIHELTIFYVPYFFIVLYLDEKKINIKKYINYYLAVIFPVILIYFFGSKINNGTSISLLQSKGINCGEYGVFQYNESGNFINTYLRHIESYSLYIIPVIIGFIILNLYFKYYKINYKWKQILIILFLYSLPLFYFANDWGRWINIHFTLITIILLTYFSRKKVIFPPYFIYFIPLMLVWGYSILEKGFHFNTYLNYLVLNKILHLNYSFY